MGLLCGNNLAEEATTVRDVPASLAWTGHEPDIADTKSVLELLLAQYLQEACHLQNVS